MSTNSTNEHNDTQALINTTFPKTYGNSVNKNNSDVVNRLVLGVLDGKSDIYDISGGELYSIFSEREYKGIHSYTPQSYDDLLCSMIWNNLKFDEVFEGIDSNISIQCLIVLDSTEEDIASGLQVKVFGVFDIDAHQYMSTVDAKTVISNIAPHLEWLDTVDNIDMSNPKKSILSTGKLLFKPKKDHTIRDIYIVDTQ